MTNPTQEIPAEELERIKNNAIIDASNPNHRVLDRMGGYIEGAKAEFIRARQQAQRETPPRWVKASERLPDDHITHAARFIGTSGYEYTSLTIEDMDVFIGEESHYMIRNFPKGLLKSLEWLEEVSALAQYTSDSPPLTCGCKYVGDQANCIYPDCQMPHSENKDAEDIPVPEEIMKWIEEQVDFFSVPAAKISGRAMSISMYLKLTESARKQPDTMGKELRFRCNWSNKACDEFVVCMEDEEERQYYTVLNGVFARLVFNKDLIDDRRRVRQEAADYRKVLEKIRTNIAEGLVYTRPMKSREMHQIAAEILDKYPSPPTK